MTEHDPIGHSPLAKLAVELLAKEILVRPIGDLVLAHPIDRMFERIDRGIGGDRSELSDARIDSFGIALEIRIVAELAVLEGNSFADRREPAELGVAKRRARMDLGLAVAARRG
jgi:hypothetical protein